jgi:transcriptional regulator with XRE-family HTH domain
MATVRLRYPNRLRECIKLSGYTIKEVAEESNIPIRTLFDYCRGKTPIPRKRLAMLASLLGYPVESIITPMNDTLNIMSQIETENTQETASTSLEAHEMDKQRRELLQQAPGFVSAAFMTSSHLLLNEDLLDRLSNALTKPSSIDETTLNYLEARTEGYWQDRHGAVVASRDLLSYVVDHLQKIIALLEGSLLPTLRARLCAIASKTAQLVGELLLDMSYYTKARQFHQAAITIAQETANQQLESIAWGRMSLAYIYSGNEQEALECIHKARRLTVWNNGMVNAWLAAIQAEIWANFAESDACLKALSQAEQFDEQQLAIEDSYLIHFDRALLGGYQGVCFRKLYRPENIQSTLFLGKAQKILIESLNSLNPALIQRQPTFLTDLADTYLQQGEIEEACKRAIQAATIASQIKLQKVIQRLLKLRQELEPWKDTPHVQAFTSHLLEMSHTT